MANTATVSFKVPPEDYVAIVRIASDQKVTVSYLCRTVVCHALQADRYWRFMLAERASDGAEAWDPKGDNTSSSPDLPLAPLL